LNNIDKYLKHLGKSRVKLSDASEDEILKLVQKIFPENLIKTENLTVPAFVDDACVIDPNLIGDGNELVVTSDVLVEGADFLFEWMSSYDLGIKSLAVNLSDLAAMGAEPIGMTVVIGVNPDFSLSELESFIQGLCEQAIKYKVLLLGGDLSASEKFFVNITLLGRVPKGKTLRRDNAQEDDVIAVTGYPGEARAGFEIVSKNVHNVRKEERILTSRFLRPEPRLDVGYILRDSGAIRGCIDLSDGLARDLSRLAKTNGLKAQIYAELLPVSSILKNFWVSRNKDYIEMICRGGEDFELLFSVTPENFDLVKQKVESFTGIAITRIGEWTAGNGVIISKADSSELDISNLGFDHFKKE